MTAANNPAFGITGRRAAGGYIAMGSGPTADDVPALLSRGEVVFVPAHMVSAGAVDHLRGALPGFAGGGLVPSYKGNAGGLGPWTTGNVAAFENTMTTAMEKAMTAATKQAQQAFGFGMHVPNVGSGAMRWLPLVNQVLAMEGLNPYLAMQVITQISSESGGNPNAINLTDANAQHGDPSRGLLQTIMSTFLRWHWPGTSYNIYDPLANIAAAVNYAAHPYGPQLMRGGMGIGSGRGYAAGGIVGAAVGPTTNQAMLSMMGAGYGVPVMRRAAWSAAVTGPARSPGSRRAGWQARRPGCRLSIPRCSAPSRPARRSTAPC